MNQNNSAKSTNEQIANNLSFSLLAKYLVNQGHSVEYTCYADDPTPYAQITTSSGSSAVLNTSMTSYPFASIASRLIYSDKVKATDLVARLGVATSPSCVTDTYDQGAEQFIKEYGTVIVKPRKSQGSRGLTLNVQTSLELKNAISSALEHSQKAIIQPQFNGEEVRFMAMNGNIVSALLRQTPQVIGDGCRTVAELIEAENVARKGISDTVVPYPMLGPELAPLAATKLSGIPVEGEVILLSRATMISRGASIYEIIDTIHPSYIQAAQTISNAFGRGLIAIDFMIEDLSRAASPENYIFLEMNGDPALSLCYSVRDGRHFRIVEDYLGPMLINVIDKDLLTDASSV